MSEYIYFADTTEIPPGTNKHREMKGLPIVVFNLDGVYYAIEDSCSHSGGPLSRGYLDSEEQTIVCPWHTWKFHIPTGKCTHIDNEFLKTYPLKITNNQIFIEI